MKRLFFLPLAAFLFLAPACAEAGPRKAANPETEDEKTVYAIGLTMARNLGNHQPSHIITLTWMPQSITRSMRSLPWWCNWRYRMPLPCWRNPL